MAYLACGLVVGDGELALFLQEVGLYPSMEAGHLAVSHLPQKHMLKATAVSGRSSRPRVAQEEVLAHLISEA